MVKCTYVKGYGSYTDEEGLDGAGLIVEFEHPNMKDYGRLMHHQLKMVLLLIQILCVLDYKQLLIHL